jgi:5-amino-6-(5-phosphoribosylamino)uracil reductase
VDRVRSRCDAILVGAETIRRDDPRLVLRDARPAGDEDREDHGAGPLKVTVTRTGQLPPDAAFFRLGEARKIVYCPTTSVDAARTALGPVATIVGCGERVRAREIGEDLHRRGVRRLLVEGGARVQADFLQEDLVDELHLAVAPLFVGDSRAPRFGQDGRYPWTRDRRARLVDTEQVGDVAVLTYALSERFTPGWTGGPGR